MDSVAKLKVVDMWICGKLYVLDRRLLTFARFASRIALISCCVPATVIGRTMSFPCHLEISPRAFLGRLAFASGPALSLHLEPEEQQTASGTTKTFLHFIWQASMSLSMSLCFTSTASALSLPNHWQVKL